MKMKKLIYLLITVMLILLFTACGEEKEEDIIEIRGYTEGEQTEYIYDNEYLTLTFDAETTHFTVLEKESGKLWYSNPEDYAEDTVASTAYKAALQATMLISYTNKNGDDNSYNNYNYSIKNGLYEVEPLENGIKVKYTIGDIEREYEIPLAVPESRMKQFYDLMERKSQKSVDEYYRKIDINNLRATDNKSELLAMYPDLENEPMYVIRDSIQPYLKVKLETLFAAVGYTYEDYLEDVSRYSGGTTTEKPTFNISMLIELNEDELVISIPLEEIEYRSDYPLVKVSPLPYFGCGGTSDDGYILVPDGSGGIINFNNGKIQQNAYYNNVFGWDYGQIRTIMISENTAYYPVYGIANGDSSFLCILEDGASDAAINADISGRYNSYNYAYATYQLLHYEDLDVSAKSQKTVRVFENEVPEGSFTQRYCFVGDTEYISLAEEYREYLTKKYPNLTKDTDANVPMTVEIIGAVDKTEQKFGIPTVVDLELTTYKEAEAMIKELYDSDLPGLSIKLNGWFNRGVSHKVPSSVKLISKLGSKSDFKSLLETSAELGITTYLETGVEFVYRNSALDGFIAIRDAAKYISKEVAEEYPFWPTTFRSKDDADYLYYLVKPSYSMSLIDSFMKSIKKLGSNSVAFKDIGKYLGADYNKKNIVTREEVIALQQEKLAELQDAGSDIMIYSGNVYAVPYADMILDLMLATKGANIIDLEVPFYTMALHGLVDFAGDAVNLSADYEKNLLKTMETGAGLYFVMMNAGADELEETLHNEFYGSDYSLWKEDIISIYHKMQEDMGNTYNQYITEYKVINSGVRLTGYEDGTRVIVNYCYDDYVYNGITIPARDYIVERGGE